MDVSRPKRENGFQLPWNWQQCLVVLCYVGLTVGFIFFWHLYFRETIAISLSMTFAFPTITLWFIVEYLNPERKPSKDPSFAGIDQTDNSRYCQPCNKFVTGFDHHCVWLNQCIGRSNYRYFISMLVAFLCQLSTQLFYSLSLYTVRNIPIGRHIGICVLNAVSIIAWISVVVLLLFHSYLYCSRSSTYNVIVQVLSRNTSGYEQANSYITIKEGNVPTLESLAKEQAMQLAREDWQKQMTMNRVERTSQQSGFSLEIDSMSAHCRDRHTSANKKPVKAHSANYTEETVDCSSHGSYGRASPMVDTIQECGTPEDITLSSIGINSRSSDCSSFKAVPRSNNLLPPLQSAHSPSTKSPSHEDKPTPDENVLRLSRADMMEGNIIATTKIKPKSSVVPPPDAHPMAQAPVSEQHRSDSGRIMFSLEQRSDSGRVFTLG